MQLQFRTLARLKKKMNFDLSWGYNDYGTENQGCLLTMIGVATLGNKRKWNKLIENRWVSNKKVHEILAKKLNIDPNKLGNLEAGFEEWEKTDRRPYINTNHPQYKVGRRLHKKFRKFNYN